MAPPGRFARHIWPLVALGLLVCAYFVPQLATGTVQFDGVDVHYSWQRYFSEALHNGRLPFWTPYVFTGFPFLADIQVGAWYPLNWPFFLAGIEPASISLELLVHSLIACAGAYALGVRFFGQPLPALATAMFYGLSGWFAAHSQHVGMFETAAWLPWLVLLLEQAGERLSLARLALASLLGAAMALPGHFQVALYALTGAGVWALLDALVQRAWARPSRLASALAAVAVGGAALSAVMILPAFELVAHSLRARLNPSEVDIGYFHLGSLLTLVQPDHYGLLSGKYIGPGDVTQHYFYAGIGLVPLAIFGARHARVRRTAALLGLPFLWYAVGPLGGLFRLVVRLPGFNSVELPMHGWFLPALGLALLGGAGLSRVAARLPRAWVLVLLAAVYVDVLTVNQLLNPLAFARQSFDALYGAPLRSFQAQVDTAQPPVERLYGPPLAAIGYRNHPLQSHVAATYGYNPLELANYGDYADAAEINPRLRAGLAATYRLADNLRIEPGPDALPLAFFARRLTSVADAATARERLGELDPAAETIVVGPTPDVQVDPAATARVVARGDDWLTIHVQTASVNVLRVAVPLFPGWHASLNGAELPTLPVDLAFQGIVVPAGEGDIRLEYTPRFFWIGGLISGLALLTCAGVLVGALPQRPRG
ncbi:MAG: YfhO family protein [Chloroflexi bacterium]|nr:YfhO family protein [Chloroflexota bacterium]